MRRSARFLVSFTAIPRVSSRRERGWCLPSGRASRSRPGRHRIPRSRASFEVGRGRGVRTDTPNRSLQQEIDNSIPVPRISKTTEPEHRSPLTGIKMIILDSTTSHVPANAATIFRDPSLPSCFSLQDARKFSNCISTTRPISNSLKSLFLSRIFQKISQRFRGNFGN